MDQRELYNVRDLPQEEGPGGGGGLFPGGRGTDSSFVLLVNQTRWELISSDEEFVSSDRESVQLCVLSSYSIISNLCINCCLIKAQLLDPLSINSL